MAFSDILAVVGIIVTISSAAYAMVQARDAKRYSENARKVFHRVLLSSTAERIKNILEHSRAIAPDRLNQRGVQLNEKTDKIREEFDLVLGALGTGGDAGSARCKILEAQEALRKYEGSVRGPTGEADWHTLRRHLQDAVSMLSEDSKKTMEVLSDNRD